MCAIAQRASADQLLRLAAMQTFDMLTLLFAAALLLILILRRDRLTSWLCLLVGLACVGLLATHLISEGSRWQMLPAYLTIAALLSTLGYRARKTTSSTSKSLITRIGIWGGFAIATLLLSLSALLSYAFPVFELSSPKGSFAIGTTEMHLVDTTRPEEYTEGASDKRELMVRIWYPAEDIKASERAFYWNHAAIRSAAVTASTPLPWFTFTHLGRVPTNSYWNAPVANAQQSYPVVLYSHGIGIGWESANTKLAEELASHGYIVVGINHTHIGSVSIFPDGRVVEHHAPTGAAMSERPPKAMAGIQSKMQTSLDWREQIELYRQAMSIMPEAALTAVGKALDTQVADQRSVLQELAQLQTNHENPLADHLNLNRIGVIGMSLGGSAAFEYCLDDSRCTAGVNLDGFHPRHIDLAPQDTPFLYLHREENLLYQSNFQRSSAAAYSVSIPDSTHFNFFDFSVMSPLYKRMGILGPIDGNRMLEITQESVLTFFDLHLKGNELPGWPAQLTNYQDITLDQRNET